jgi:hypothetical protein
MLRLELKIQNRSIVTVFLLEILIKYFLNFGILTEIKYVKIFTDKSLKELTSQNKLKGYSNILSAIIQRIFLKCLYF